MQWTQLLQAGELPEERSSHTITAIGNKIYLFGGEHSPRIPISSDLYVYDLESKSWSKADAKGKKPSPRLGHAATAVGHELFIFGGRSGVEMVEEAKNDMYAYNTITSTWSLVECKGAVPTKRSYHTMTAVDSTIFVFGGCAEVGRLNDIYSFDIPTSTWSLLPTPSEAAVKPRGGSVLVAVNDSKGSSLFVAGGFCGHELGDMHEYSIQDKKWLCPSCMGCGGADSFRPRSVYGAASLADGSIIAFGGEVDPSDKGHEGAGDFTADVVVWNRSSGWKSAAVSGDLPCARGWYAYTSLSDGRFVVHGGLGLTNDRLGDMFMLQES